MFRMPPQHPPPSPSNHLLPFSPLHLPLPYACQISPMFKLSAPGIRCENKEMCRQTTEVILSRHSMPQPAEVWRIAKKKNVHTCLTTITLCSSADKSLTYFVHVDFAIFFFDFLRKINNARFSCFPRLCNTDVMFGDFHSHPDKQNNKFPDICCIRVIMLFFSAILSRQQNWSLDRLVDY